MAETAREGQLPPEIVSALPAARGVALVEELAQTECPALTVRRARRAERSGAPHDPIVWARALGSNVWDVDGNRFVDLSAGFGAAAVGHGRPEVVAAVQRQAPLLCHALGDVHPSEPKVALLSRLRTLCPWDDGRAMLGLSGSDAVTAALKTAVLATGRSGVLAFEGAYHGLAYAPLSACGYSPAFRAPFAAQLNPAVRFAPYPTDAAEAGGALSQAHEALASGEVGAVLVEPVLGRGGVVVPPEGFVAEVGALCRAHGALLIADEILCGLGRVGAMWASVADGATPDLICAGKALGGGLPVSACLGRGEVMAAWGDPGSEALHTSTFAGNPLGAVAALAALDVIEREGLAARAQRVGAGFAERLRARLGDQAAQVRGRGLLLGMDLGDGARALAAGRALLERGYITVPAAADARVISLTPPLDIEAALLDGFADTLAEVLQALPETGA
jgi:4-aminobutyrate aminotransferase/(S)-3-amino-2-methylpropionate transaminase